MHVINADLDFVFSVLFSLRINHTVILDDPFDDPPGLCVPDRSPEPTKEQLDVSVRDRKKLEEIFK